MTQWMAGIVVAVIGAASAYILAVRKASGRIETTEASELWSEGSKLREEYRHEIADLRELTTSLRTRTEQLAVDNDRLHHDNARLLKRIAKIEDDDG